MFRLAHLSDIHLAPLPPGRIGELLSKRFLGYLNWHMRRKHIHSRKILESILADLSERNPDHIAITGDIVNIALMQELENAAQFLKENFDPVDTTVVLGNHDAYVPGAFESAITKMQSFMSGSGQKLISAADYPLTRICGDIALICVNSAIPTAPFMATGQIKQEQANKLALSLREAGNSGLCRVVLIHHPPVHDAASKHKRLIGIDAFQAAVAEAGAELVLHGHTHLPTQMEIGGRNKPVPVIGVCSASNSTGDHKPPARYNIFTLEKSGSSWSILQEQYGINANPDQIEFLQKTVLA